MINPCTGALGVRPVESRSHRHSAIGHIGPIKTEIGAARIGDELDRSGLWGWRA